MYQTENSKLLEIALTTIKKTQWKMKKKCSLKFNIILKNSPVQGEVLFSQLTDRSKEMYLIGLVLNRTFFRLNGITIKFVSYTRFAKKIIHRVVSCLFFHLIPLLLLLYSPSIPHFLYFSTKPLPFNIRFENSSFFTIAM